MDIVNRLPRDAASKIKFHFRHPCASMIEKYWKEPELLKQKWVIAQLNRYNWLIHSHKLHNFGNDQFLTYFNGTIVGGIYHNATTDWKLRFHNIIDPHGTYVSNFTLLNSPHLAQDGVTLYIHHQILKRIQNKIWIRKRGVASDNHNEWKKRSLYGGIYPVNKRPKVRAPRNPFTNKWNLRWKRNSILHNLYYNKKLLSRPRAHFSSFSL